LSLPQGRGFTLEEVKKAGFANVKYARSIGISVDHRRKNRSEPLVRGWLSHRVVLTFQQFLDNVQRLKNYKAKLVLFPKETATQLKTKASERCFVPCSLTALRFRTTRSSTALPRTSRPRVSP
jgi:hypothetical protein